MVEKTAVIPAMAIALPVIAFFSLVWSRAPNA